MAVSQRRYNKLTDSDRENLNSQRCPLDRMKPAARSYLGPIHRRCIAEGKQGCSCRRKK